MKRCTTTRRRQPRSRKRSSRRRVTNISRKLGELLKSQVTLFSEPGPGWQSKKVIGAEDSVFAELVKELPQEKIFDITGCFQGRFHGSGRSSQLFTKSNTCICEEARRRAKEGNQKFQGDCAHVDDVEVVRDLHDLTLGKGNGPQGWKQLHVGEVDVTGGQHFHVIIAQLSQKHGGVAGHQMERLLARQRKQTHDVGRWPGHLDGLRCVRGRNDAETKLFELNIFLGACAADFADWVPNQTALPSCDHTQGRQATREVFVGALLIAQAMSTMRFIDTTLWTDVSPLADIRTGILEDGSRSLEVEGLR